MKETKNVTFAKASITEEDGEFIIIEVVKDDTKVYNLTEKIREWIGVEGITLKLTKDSEIPSEE